MTIKITLLTFLICLLLNYGTFPQAAGGQDTLFATPYAVLYNHIHYLESKNYDPTKAAKSLYPLGNPKNREVLAVKLNQIFTGRGLLLEMEQVPKDSNFTIAVQGNRQVHKYVPFPNLKEIYVVKYQDHWVYSKTSVANIQKLHDSTYPFRTGKLLQILEYFTINSGTFLGLQYWQYIGICLIIIFVLFAYGFTRVVLRKLYTFLLKKYSYQFPQQIQQLTHPISLVVIFLVMRILVVLLQFPVSITYYTNLTIKVLITVFIAITLYRGVDILFFYLKKIADKTENTLDDRLLPILRRPTKGIVILAGLIVILQTLEFNITGILAGISIGGLAFALAAQDTIKNLFGSLMIFIDKPFEPGDWIISKDVDGSVEEIGLRSTKIRAFSDSLISIPNGRLADQTIDNMGMRHYRRFKTSIGIKYNTPPDAIENFVKRLEDVVLSHSITRKDYFHIYLNEFSSSSLNILFYIFFEAPTWQQELKARHEIMLAIIGLAHEMGIDFAFPSQSIYMETIEN